MSFIFITTALKGFSYGIAVSDSSVYIEILSLLPINLAQPSVETPLSTREWENICVKL